MLIRELMTSSPVTISPETSVLGALQLMRERDVRCLPVSDYHGHLAGIVSEKDLLCAAPVPANGLDASGGHDLLAKLPVEKVMTREVVTVSEEAPIEEAAHIMSDHKIGGLPVMRHAALVGLVTKADLFRALLQLLGGSQPGVRIAVSISDVPGTVTKIACAIFSVGGKIVGLGLNEGTGAGAGQRQMTVKAQGVTRDRLVMALRPVVREILDVQEL